jgi:protein-tyrosine phosphatase
LDRKKAVQKIKTFLEHNITTFVCLQERSELKRFKPYWDIVEAENKNAKQIIFEIEDMGVADEESVDVFTNELVSLYNQGENMLIHCWGGHGRSGYIAAIVLGKLYNLTPQEALRRVQAAHDCRSGGIKSTSPQHYTQFQQVVSILKKHQSKM